MLESQTYDIAQLLLNQALRLSDYYAAKAISIDGISDNDNDGLRLMLEKLSPEQITFGKDPALPIEKIIDLISSMKR